MRYRTPVLAFLLLTLATIAILLLTFGPWGTSQPRPTQRMPEADPDMVLIPGGTFVMGTDESSVPGGSATSLVPPRDYCTPFTWRLSSEP
jgi:hypothetical protein